jgi:hypothetical protein
MSVGAQSRTPSGAPCPGIDGMCLTSNAWRPTRRLGRTNLTKRNVAG